MIPHRPQHCLSPPGQCRQFLSQQVFQNHVVKHGIGQQAFELGILIRQRLQLRSVGHFHAAIPGLQPVERRRAESMVAKDFGSRHPGFLLLDHPDDLRLGEAALSDRLLLRD